MFSVSWRLPVFPVPVVRLGRRRDRSFSCIISISHNRQKISRKRTRKFAVIQCNNSAPGIQNSTPPQADAVGLSGLSFDRLQPTDQDCKSRHKRAFGKFVAREAILDEEYWQHGCVQRAIGRTNHVFVMLIATRENLQSRSSML